MRVLVIQHHPEEGPGRLGRFLQARGARLLTVHLYRDQGLPPDLRGLDAVVSMGGPMNVYQEREHPWIPAELALLARAADENRPVLGICLGAQLLARALGARVVASPVEEIGWGRVSLTPAAEGDPLWRGVAPELTVVQWHRDMFQLPAGARLTAGGRECPHQAFSRGRAFGLQFHLEATRGMLRRWCEDDERWRRFREPWDQLAPAMEAQAEMVFRNFWGMVAGA